MPVASGPNMMPSSATRRKTSTARRHPTLSATRRKHLKSARMSVCSERSNPAETVANGGSGRDAGASRVRKTADRNGFRITVPVALLARFADWAKASVLVGGNHVDQGSRCRRETAATQVADTDQSSDFMVCECAPPRSEWLVRSNSLSRDTSFVDLEWRSGAGRLQPSG